MPFFSVIIPIYRVEKYLKRCVDSVLAQEFKDFEVILVDDGSPDGCPQICDEYAKKDNRVKVVHKVNGGLSDARNAGIDVATGEYLMFLDGDDYFTENALEQVKSMAASSVDVIIFAAVKWYYLENRSVPDSIYYPEALNNMDCEAALTYLVKNGLYIGSACTKAVQRRFLLEQKLYFRKGIKSEDVEWCLRLLRCLKSVQFFNEKVYVYRKGRLESISNSIDERHLRDCYEMILDAWNLRQDKSISNERRDLILNYAAYQYTVVLGLLSQVKVGEELRAAIKALCPILQYHSNKKTKLCWCMYRLLGYQGLRMALRIYMKIR